MKGDRMEPAVEDKKTSITYLSVFKLLAVFVTAMLLFAGCIGSKPTNFYILDPLVRYSQPGPTVDIGDISIGIRPVEIPQYLNRTKIVTRSGRHEIDVAEFEHWGEALETSILRVFSENLSALLSTNRIMTYPWVKRKPLYEIEIEIIQFDGGVPGNVELSARWSLLKNGMVTHIDRKKFTDQKPIAGQGYQGMVSTMSLVLYEMSRVVANEIILDTTNSKSTVTD